MFHNSRNKAVCAIGDSVCLALCCMVKETVDKYRPVRSNADSRRHIHLHHFVIVYYFHTSAAQNIRRTNHNGISDAVSYFKSFVNIYRHSRFGHGNAELIHHSTEIVSVFRKVDCFGSCAENVYTIFLKVARKIKRSLSAELSDNTERLFFIVDRKNIFKCQRLKIQLIRSIIVG